MPSFDVAALRRAAGNTLFARGEKYHQDGRVEIRAHEPEVILARVSGSRSYSVKLTGQGTAIGGSCNCPPTGNGRVAGIWSQRHWRSTPRAI